jgi:CRISPR-associated RAMP protein (TIGR02581 family)
MLKAFVNDASVRVKITTTGPLLIKSGAATVFGADMVPVQTYRHGQDEIYLPGSSLKGIFRSHIEKIVNSLKPRLACNPLLDREEDSRDQRQLYRTSCGSSLKEKAGASTLYASSCPVCRLFGSTSFVGRISVADAYLPAEFREDHEKLIEHRDGIAIDRLTGGVSGNAKFDLAPVTAETTFITTIRLRNFEIWQLGMFFAILHDLEDELIQLGSGRSRGLGRVRGEISEEPEESHPGGLVLSIPRALQQPKEPVNELWGLGRWLHEEHEAEIYGTLPNDRLTLSSKLAHTRSGVRNIRVFTGTPLADLRDQCIEAFVTRMQQWADTRAAQAGR